MKFENTKAVENHIALKIKEINNLFALMDDEHKKEEPDYKLIATYSKEVKKIAHVNLLDFITENTYFIH